MKLSKIITTCCFATILPILTGCGFSFQHLYWHDETRLSNAKDGQEKFQVGREANKALWDSQLRNQQKGYEGNRKRIETSGKIRFDGILVAIDDLEWDKIWECGEGICEEMPELTEFRVTDEDKAAIKKLYPTGTTEDRLKTTLEEIQKISEDIGTLSQKIKSDPNGELELSKLPAGEVNKPISDLRVKIALAVKEIDGKTASVRKSINDVIDGTDVLRENASSVVDELFAGQDFDTQNLEDVLEVLRKKDFLDAIKEGPIKAAIEKGEAEELPQEFRNALKSNVKNEKGQPLQVSTVGELLEFLSTENSEIEEIRLSLLQDMRANLLEIRASKLNELKAKLMLLKKKVQVLTDQRAYERGLAMAESRITQYCEYRSRVVDTLEAQHQRYQTTSPTAFFLLHECEITNRKSFAVKLRDANDPLSKHIRNQLSSATQDLLAAYDDSQQLSKDLLSNLTNELNQILKAKSLFEEKRFKNVKLGMETLRLAKQNPSGEDLIKLNRLLLADAYPNQVAEIHSRQDIRDEFEDVVLFLGQYTERVGHLRDAEVLVDLQMKSLDHQLSIERSRIATLGREAMIARGLMDWSHFPKVVLPPKRSQGPCDYCPQPS